MSAKRDHWWKIFWEEFFDHLKSRLHWRIFFSLVIACVAAAAEHFAQVWIERALAAPVSHTASSHPSQGFLTTETLVALLVVTSLFFLSSVVFEAAIATQETLLGDSIQTKKLEQLASESSVILYVSYLPAFSDWFRPELVKYLLETSPKLAGVDNNKCAVRLFVVEKSDMDHRAALASHRESLAAKALSAIHTQLGIDACYIYRHDFDALRQRSSSHRSDFCVGFTGVGNIRDLLAKKADHAIRQQAKVLIPNAEDIDSVTLFDFLEGQQRTECITLAISLLEHAFKPGCESHFKLATIVPS